MINFNQDQEKQFNELLNKAFKNAQTFNQHKNQSKMKQRKQYETFIGDGYQLDYTLLLTDWAGDNETPGASDVEVIDATIIEGNKSFNLPPAFIFTFIERKLLKIIQ